MIERSTGRTFFVVKAIQERGNHPARDGGYLCVVPGDYVLVDDKNNELIVTAGAFSAFYDVLESSG